MLEFSKPQTKSGWPSIKLKHKVMLEGCHIVPRTPRRLGEKGPKTWMKLGWRQMRAPPAWRISFSLSEKLLVETFSMPQRKCFLLLKTLLKTVALNVNEELEEKHGEDNFTRFKVSSFLLKHTMFWSMEEVDMLEWRMNNLHKCILHVISKLESFLADRCVPHYFFGKRKKPFKW